MNIILSSLMLLALAGTSNSLPPLHPDDELTSKEMEEALEQAEEYLDENIESQLIQNGSE